jgi:hypothetical protein
MQRLGTSCTLGVDPVCCSACCCRHTTHPRHTWGASPCLFLLPLTSVTGCALASYTLCRVHMLCRCVQQARHTSGASPCRGPALAPVTRGSPPGIQFFSCVELLHLMSQCALHSIAFLYISHHMHHPAHMHHPQHMLHMAGDMCHDAHLFCMHTCTVLCTGHQSQPSILITWTTIHTCTTLNTSIPTMLMGAGILTLAGDNIRIFEFDI